jgi:hypothetical protein
MDSEADVSARIDPPRTRRVYLTPDEKVVDGRTDREHARGNELMH